MDSVIGTIRSTKLKKNKVNDIEYCTNEFINNDVNYKIKDTYNADTIGYKKSSSIVYNASGWIRIYCGPYRDVIDFEEPSRMVHVISSDTTKNISDDMELPAEYTIWMQIGGAATRRLSQHEYPFIVQDNFLKKIGYKNSSRRARLGIDPDLKYLLRFYIGPSEVSMCRGVQQSGTIEILKGLVFPQWKRRSVAIFHNLLYVFPGNTISQPEIYDLSTVNIVEHLPCYNRLILKIESKIYNENGGIKDDCHSKNKSVEYLFKGNSNCEVYSSSRSVNSIGDTIDRERVLFIGFEESWERDLWSSWLIQASTQNSNEKLINISSSGLQPIPEIVLQSMHSVEELLAGQNKLQEIGLHALSKLHCLRILRLPGNSFSDFPTSLLNLSDLLVLDLSDNAISDLPEDIYRLERLEELCLDRNKLTDVPQSLSRLLHLKSLQLSKNHLAEVPAFLLKMKTIGLMDSHYQHPDNHDLNHLNPPLTRVSLRANHLRGSIILGNYGYLTQLDVSENDIEVLDLSALDKLETLQCSRNRLRELTLNGRVLRSLIAGNNDLTKLIIIPDPHNLRHLDISFNNLRQLPACIPGCHHLQTLFASNNRIEMLPPNLFTNEIFSLRTIQLEYNNIQSLPPMPEKSLPLHELFLQNNSIEDLPENFFIACDRLMLLNISRNKLLTLPIIDGKNSALERLYATCNNFTDRVLDTLSCLTKLKVLHAAYNRLTTFSENCSTLWPDLEELVLSGNKLQHLPEDLANMPNLKVLRIHSNQLQSVPALARTTALRILDLAHNQFDLINLVSLVSKKLKFLDLSCNNQLQVDPKQLEVCQSQRPMSLVNVSGKNRQSLPSSPHIYQENMDFQPPWKVGFSETAGNVSRLYISQLRLPCFCNNEGLFGLFDGESSRTIPVELTKIIPKILLDERTVKETAEDYMKYTLLSAHRELKQQGQRQGVSAIICHISLEREHLNQYHPNTITKRKFILRVASVGEISAILIRQSGNVKLTPITQNRQIGNSAGFPMVIPDPDICEVTLGDQDEYLVIANKKLWEVLDPPAVIREIRSEENILLAAKRIQDIATSYGAEENISVIVVKFSNVGTNADYLIRELKQTIGKKPNSHTISGYCRCGCCCESNNNCVHSGGALQFIRQPSGRSDRSSPSGQSDHTGSELSGSIFKKTLDSSSSIGSRKTNNYTPNDRRSLRGGVVEAVRARIEEEQEREREETDSTLSEEQFKCWEYMLEQNHQLLFDKELNTISKAFSKNLPNSSNLTRAQIKALSSSTPQLSYNDMVKPVITHYHRHNGSVPLLSKHFGSARSFHPHSSGLFKSLRMSSDRFRPINAGPNAAYFGSLQRLMPYNLKYDFAVTHEKMMDESLDHERRMQQYWGVATTEL